MSSNDKQTNSANLKKKDPVNSFIFEMYLILRKWKLSKESLIRILIW